MTIAAYALLDAEGRVANIVKADEAWAPPDGLTKHLATDGCRMGGRWAGEGWEPAPVPEPPVPESVSRFQARAALTNAGLIEDVEAAVAASDALTKLAWADALAFERASSTIAMLAGALGLTDTQVDDLFRAAAEIRA